MSTFGGFAEDESRTERVLIGQQPQVGTGTDVTIQDVATSVKTPDVVLEAFLKELDLSPGDDYDLIGFVGEEALLGAATGLVINEAPASTGQKAHATRFFRECLKRAVMHGAPLPGLILQPPAPAPKPLVAGTAEPKPKEE